MIRASAELGGVLVRALDTGVVEVLRAGHVIGRGRWEGAKVSGVQGVVSGIEPPPPELFRLLEQELAKASPLQSSLFNLGAAAPPVAPTRWHTPTENLEPIFREGRLRAQTQGADLPPAVWFSTDTFLEPSAAGLFHRKEMGQRGGEIARIAALPHLELTVWRIFARTLPFDARLSLEGTGRLLGADPRLWWLTIFHVATENLGAVEVWNGTSWVATHPPG